MDDLKEVVKEHGLGVDWSTWPTKTANTLLDRVLDAVRAEVAVTY